MIPTNGSVGKSVNFNEDVEPTMADQGSQVAL